MSVKTEFGFKRKHTLKSMCGTIFSNFLIDVNLYMGSRRCLFSTADWKVGGTKRAFIFCLVFCKICNSQLLKFPSLNTVDFPCSAAGRDFTVYSSVSAEQWKTRNCVPRSSILLCSDSLVLCGKQGGQLLCGITRVLIRTVRMAMK